MIEILAIDTYKKEIIEELKSLEYKPIKYNKPGSIIYVKLKEKEYFTSTCRSLDATNTKRFKEHQIKEFIKTIKELNI